MIADSNAVAAVGIHLKQELRVVGVGIVNVLSGGGRVIILTGHTIDLFFAILVDGDLLNHKVTVDRGSHALAR